MKFKMFNLLVKRLNKIFALKYLSVKGRKGKGEEGFCIKKKSRIFALKIRDKLREQYA